MKQDKNMNLVAAFQNNIKQQNLFLPKDKLVVAVSGGIDSVVLCELCKQSGYDFIIAHCNFQLRGEESGRDEAFVRSLGGKYNITVLVKQFNTEEYADENKIGIQEAARDLRYAWFKEIIDSNSLATGELQSKKDDQRSTNNYVLTAHHADDNAETVLMNFFRGTGLHGLTGIPAAINHLRRPLLAFSKEELIQFAKEQRLDFVEDSSNQSSKYTRNFFRHAIIPAIGKMYPQVKENLQDNINRFKEIEKLYRFSVNEIKNKLCKKKGNEIHIPVKQLMGYNNNALIYEIISEYGFADKQVDEIIKLAGSDSGKYIQSPDRIFRIIKNRHWFIISPVQSTQSENIIIEETDKSIQFAEGILRLETTDNGHLATGNESASLDSKDIQFPLFLRKWKAGDYFYPLGMKKKKKLARFFVDQKLSKTDKEKVWILEMNKKIIWVVGHRIDDRFKITGKTKKVLKIDFNSRDQHE